MNINLNNIGKQYNGEWIFKSVSLSFSNNHSYLIAGGNGSGKSSLLKLISGYSVASQGEIQWSDNDDNISAEEIHQHVSICAPSIELFDKHTVIEAVNFHFNFKVPIIDSMSSDEVIKLCYLEDSVSKEINQLSSGMKQRLKLALTFLSKGSLLLLDEPCSNLDDKAIKWYQDNLEKYRKNRLVIICSNNKEEEHFICDKTITLEDFKEV